jgi:transcriptional regulator with XRE-family HTH domain
MNLTPRRLKRRRVALELTQIALAKISGVTRYNITMFENGHREFKPSEQAKVLAAITEGETNAANKKIEP